MEDTQLTRRDACCLLGAAVLAPTTGFAGTRSYSGRCVFDLTEDDWALIERRREMHIMTGDEFILGWGRTRQEILKTQWHFDAPIESVRIYHCSRELQLIFEADPDVLFYRVDENGSAVPYV
jgi:hypothetical protein